MPRKKYVKKHARKYMMKYRRHPIIPKTIAQTTRIFKVRQYHNFGSTNTIYINSTVAAIAGTPIPSFGAYNFQLSNCDNITQFQALFDQYRFMWAEVTFKPQQNTTNEGSVNTTIGEFMTVVDFDDSTAIGTIPLMRDYDNLKVSNCMTKHVRKFVPHMAIAAYGSGVFTSYANRSLQWIDLNSPSVQHYGVKYAFTGGLSTSLVATYSVEAFVVLEFKNVR